VILQIRGTSGSGKTTMVKHLLKQIVPTVVEWSENKKRARVYAGKYLGHKIFILGDYTIGAGGCDTIPKIEQVIDLVDRYATKYPEAIVVFEGLLLAHSWGAMGEYAHAKFGERYINAFLDTPEDTCLARVLHRRQQKSGGDTNPERHEKIEKNVRADYYRVYLCWKRVKARGGIREKVPHEDSTNWLDNRLKAYIDSLP
jgi:hypothetical protein